MGGGGWGVGGWEGGQYESRQPAREKLTTCSHKRRQKGSSRSLCLEQHPSRQHAAQTCPPHTAGSDPHAHQGLKTETPASNMHLQNQAASNNAVCTDLHASGVEPHGHVLFFHQQAVLSLHSLCQQLLPDAANIAQQLCCVCLKPTPL